VQDVPADLGSTHHAGLARAIAAYAANSTDRMYAGRVVAEMLHGYVLLDSTGTDRSDWPKGAMPAGSRLQFAVLKNDDTGLSGLSAFTSNATLQRHHPGVPLDQLSALVVPAPDVLRMVDTLGFDFLAIDYGSGSMEMPKSMTDSALDGPMNVGIRTALALDPPQRHAAVIAALANSEPSDELVVAVERASIGPNGDMSRMILATAANSAGVRVLCAFTSFTEANLACTNHRFVPQYIENVRQIAMNNGLSGVLLNSATDSDVVTAAELAAIGVRPGPAG